MTSAIDPVGATQSVDTIEFPCEEWFVTRTPQGEIVGVNPIGATWTLISAEDRRRFAERRLDVKALFACPRCKQIGFIPEGFGRCGTPDPGKHPKGCEGVNPQPKLGDIKLPELHCRKCNFVCRIILKDWDKRRLYCACYETCTPSGTIHAHKEYLHAEDENEAKKFFWAQHGPGVIPIVTNFIEIAPVIGFFLENPKNDRILIV